MKKIFLFLFLFNLSLFSSTSYEECSGDWLMDSETTVNVSLSDNAYKVLNGGTFWDCTSTVMYKYSFSNVDTASYTVDKTSQHYNIFTPNCSSNTFWDNSTQTCVTPPCTQPFGTFALPTVDETTCKQSGSINIIKDGIGTTYGELVWQVCDSTCYGIEVRNLTCDELLPHYMSMCDTTKNNFSFSCKDLNGAGLVNESKTSCKLKSNPCSDLYDKVAANCDLNTSHVIGFTECRTEGRNVINPEVMKCVLDGNSKDGTIPTSDKDCHSKWYEQYNNVSKSCECWDGYERNRWGICSKSLDSNATEQEVQQKITNDANDAKTKEQEDLQKERNKKLDKGLEDLTNTLSGVRSDLNTSNGILSTIKNLISGVSNKLDGNVSLTNTDYGINKIDELAHSYDDTANDVDSLIATLENGFVNPISSGADTTCPYNNVITGQGLSIPVNIDICKVVAPYYNTLYSIWYFLLIFVLLVFVLKIILIAGV